MAVAGKKASLMGSDTPRASLVGYIIPMPIGPIIN